jgi:hypothetical protein
VIKTCVVRAIDIVRAPGAPDFSIDDEYAWMFFPVPKYPKWRRWWVDPMTLDRIILYEED